MDKIKFVMCIVLVLTSIIYWVSMCDNGVFYQLTGLCSVIASYGLLCTDIIFRDWAKKASGKLFK